MSDFLSLRDLLRWGQESDRLGEAQCDNGSELVSLKGVSMGSIIHDLSLVVGKGEKIAVTGPSGSGKSSLAYLLSGLKRADFGSISISGHKYEDLSEAEIRRHVRLFPADPKLISGTLHENLVFGQEVSPDEVRRVLELLGIGDLYDRLGDSVISEASTALSEGEKQRVKIARAFFDSRPVQIFDEVTSFLDESVDRTIRKALLSQKDKTILFITHRLLDMDRFDRVLTFDRGQVTA